MPATGFRFWSRACFLFHRFLANFTLVKSSSVKFLVIFGIFIGGLSLCQAQLVTINGLVENPTATTLYLYQYQYWSWKPIDSTLVTDSTFSLQVEIPVRGWYKMGPGLDASFDVILGEERLDLAVDFTEKPPVTKFYHSKENTALKEYLRLIQALQLPARKIDSLARSRRQLSSSERESHNQSIRMIMDSLELVKQQFYGELLNRYPQTFIGKMSDFYHWDTAVPYMEQLRSGYLNDPELASNMYYQGKIHSLLQMVKPRNIREVEDLMDQLVNLTEPSSEAREALYITIIRFMARAPEQYRVSYTRKFQMEYPHSKAASQLVKLLPDPGPQTGGPAPDIQLPDSTGNLVSLHDLKGKYILLDFWASWCRPCRVEAPNVVKAYHKYKDKGFTIYGVSLDSRRDLWLKAIRQDGLTWHHVSDLKGWKSEGAAKYAVRSIPSTFLIDPQGNIIARNLRGSQLLSRLDEIFKENQDQ